jgi:hypothetical protein
MPLIGPRRLAACLALCLANAAGAPDAFHPENALTALHATGPFDVKLEPQIPGAPAEAAGIARMTLVKQFHGDLEAAGNGEMLSFRNVAERSGGYVALERVRGTLAGRHGSFMLQHSATMTRGEPALSITVVPDSGTDELAGIAGRMAIDIGADGAHAYRFDYTLPRPAGK